MVTKRWIVGVAAVLASGSCEREPDADSGGNYCLNRHKECRVDYSSWSSYGRYCSTVDSACTPEQSSALEPAGATADAGVSAGSGSVKGAPELGAAPLPDGQRYSAFDLRCERDSQCGPGKCIEGSCYYGCQSDAQCGTGDRCSVEEGVRICLPDPNPPVQCTRSAQCDDGRVCLNGTCLQSCASTEQCSNVLDRCASGVCQPDRRPLGQCVLNSECAAGFACLDGACVAACARAGDAGVCLPGSGPAISTPVGGQRPEQVPPVIPLSIVDAGPARPLAAADSGATEAGEPDAGSLGALLE